MDNFSSKDGVVIKDMSDEYSLIALQGPQSLEVISKLVNKDLSSKDFIDSMKR